MARSKKVEAGQPRKRAYKPRKPKVPVAVDEPQVSSVDELLQKVKAEEIAKKREARKIKEESEQAIRERAAAWQKSEQARIQEEVKSAKIILSAEAEIEKRYNWLEIPRSLIVTDGSGLFIRDRGPRDDERIKTFSDFLKAGYLVKSLTVTPRQNYLFLFEKS